jgi:hypothetical protein
MYSKQHSIKINGTFHHQHNFITDINLSHYNGNMFQQNTVIFREVEL